MYTQDEINLIALSSVAGLTYSAKRAMVRGLEEGRAEIAKPSPELIKRLGGGVYNNVVEKIRDQKYCGRILSELDRRGVTCTTVISQDYPENLKHIPESPLVLFCKGNRELLKSRMLSIVGSRATARSALARCKEFSEILSEYFTIVSGIADGADTAALEGALESGKVISILSYGFDFTYPSVSFEIKKRVAERGLLLSEHYPTERATKYGFPFRNRIIAGISKGTLIVSAGQRSGALITADCCTEYGRELFVIPYSPGIPSGAGCNALIKEGAALVDSPDDVLSAFGIARRQAEEVKLTENEAELMEHVRAAGEVFVPELADKMGKLPHELIPLLSSLEIKKQIVRLGGNRYAAV